MYYSPVSKFIHFLHSITDIGSTNWSRDPFLVALDGFKNLKANSLIIDLDSLFKDVSCQAPLLNCLTSVNNAEELKGVSPQNRQEGSGSNK
jgi:hypothetical protein